MCGTKLDPSLFKGNASSVGKTRLEQLEDSFEAAKSKRQQYFGVKIEIEGFIEPEIIINSLENFDKKLEYYKSAYNDNLTLKSKDSIKIISWAYANSFKELEFKLRNNLSC